MFDHCIVCNTTQDIQLCSGCNVAVYCSEQCQAQDWGYEHRSICGILPQLLIEKRGREKKEEDDEEDLTEEPPQRRRKVKKNFTKQQIYTRGVRNERLLREGRYQEFFESAELVDVLQMDTHYRDLFETACVKSPTLFVEWLRDRNIDISDDVSKNLENLRETLETGINDGSLLIVRLNNDSKYTKILDNLESKPGIFKKLSKMGVLGISILGTAYMVYNRFIFDPFSLIQ